MEESSTTPFAKRWLPWVLLAAVCLLGFFAALGSFHLIDVDEPRYAGAAREMMAGGDWLTPHFNSVVRFDKPVLFYWLIALAYGIFGINEFAARFWSAALASGLVFFLYGAMRRDMGERAAVAGSVILATSLQFFALARLAITDMALTAFLGGSAISFYRALTADARSSKTWAFFSYLLMGLAVLTKGPVGLVLPSAAAVLFVLCKRNFREDIKKLHLSWGIPLFLAIALPWYLLMIAKHGEAFIDNFFLRQNFGRFLQITSGHGGSPFYYLPILLGGFLPWTPFLPQSLWQSWKTMRGREPLESGRRAAVTYWLLFGAITFVFYSLSRSKLATYITPDYLPLAVLTGLLWSRSLSSPGKLAPGLGAGAVVTALYLLLASAGALQSPRFLHLFREAIDPKTGNPLELGIGPFLLGAGFLAAAVAAFFSALRKRALLCFGAIAGSSLIMILITLTAVVPILDEVRHGRLGELSKMAGREAAPDDTIVSYGLKKTSVVFYSGRPVREVDQGDLRLLKTLEQGRKGLWVLSRIEYEPELRQIGLVIHDMNPPYLLALKRATPLANRGHNPSAAGQR